MPLHSPSWTLPLDGRPSRRIRFRGGCHSPAHPTRDPTRRECGEGCALRTRTLHTVVPRPAPWSRPGLHGQCNPRTVWVTKLTTALAWRIKHARDGYGELVTIRFVPALVGYAFGHATWPERSLYSAAVGTNLGTHRYEKGPNPEIEPVVSRFWWS